MTNLTEQWKKGELPSGWYYIKGGDGGIYPAENCPNYDYINDKVDNQFYYTEDEIEEILNKVPSYEQWKSSDKLILTLMDNIKDKSDLLQQAMIKNAELKKQLAHVSRTQAKQFRDNQKLQVKAEHAKDVVNIDTARQIKQLKELLKECRDEIKFMYDTYGQSFPKPFDDSLLTKINQVLGEE